MTSTVTTTEKEKRQYSDEEIEGSYLGGRFKFRTKIVPFTVVLALIMHVVGFVGLKVFLVELINLRFATIIFNWRKTLTGCDLSDLTATYEFLQLNGLATFCMYHAGFIGIAMGAHRLWSHNSFKATLPIRIILMIFHTYTGALTIHKFALIHKMHHKASDTNGDPHNAGRGLFFAHIGWMMLKRHPEVRALASRIDRSTIEKDPVVMFQKKYFYPLTLVFAVILPIMIPVLLWGESLYVAVMMSLFGRFFSIHVVASVNSFAHKYGNKPYDKDIWPTDNLLLAILANGDGWHNFHHAFPSDYRASEFGYVNLTNTVIEFCAQRGWVYDLKRITPEMILRKAKRSGDGTHVES